MGIDNPVHLIFIAAVALIVLGPKRLPDLARSLGQGMREFRDSMSEASKDDAPVSGSLVPEQAQLVAAPAEVPATPADAVVVDPAAPVPAAPVPATPVQAAPMSSAPVQMDATQVAQPAPPAAS
jgi:sec-independent protein translocase protein TatA